MGNKQNDSENLIEIPKAKVKKLCGLFQKLEKMSQVKRREFFSRISKADCLLVSETVLNFLNGRIPPDFDSFKLLKRCAKHLKLLASKKTSIKSKKKILQSVKGLQIVTILIALIKPLLCC